MRVAIDEHLHRCGRGHLTARLASLVSTGFDENAWRHTGEALHSIARGLARAVQTSNVEKAVRASSFAVRTSRTKAKSPARNRKPTRTYSFARKKASAREMKGSSVTARREHFRVVVHQQ